MFAISPLFIIKTKVVNRIIRLTKHRYWLAIEKCSLIELKSIWKEISLSRISWISKKVAIIVPTQEGKKHKINVTIRTPDMGRHSIWIVVRNSWNEM